MATAGGTDSSAIGVPKAQEGSARCETLLRLRRPDRRAIGVTPLPRAAPWAFEFGPFGATSGHQGRRRGRSGNGFAYGCERRHIRHEGTKGRRRERQAGEKVAICGFAGRGAVGGFVASPFRPFAIGL